ncbi:MAG: hypothetical protein AAB549_01175 [Patescibacteria group bacterium]
MSALHWVLALSNFENSTLDDRRCTHAACERGKIRKSREQIFQAAHRQIFPAKGANVVDLGLPERASVTT